MAIAIAGEPPAVITYSPLPFLFLLMFTGLYMFFLPYFNRSPKRSPDAT